jgi:23S rRNA (uracil1939-C5)-methyltransferase
MTSKINIKTKKPFNQVRKSFRETTKWCGYIERLIWGGVGLGRAKDGRAVLLSAPLALFPGEEVEALVNCKSRHIEGQVITWFKSDPRRTRSGCLHAGICGGCNLLEAGLLAGTLKRQMVADLLSRQLPMLLPTWRWLEAPEDTRRHRIQLHWDGIELGFYRRNSYLIVPIQECPAATDLISQAIPRLRDALKARILSQKPQRWELVVGTPANQIFAVADNNIWRLEPDGWHRCVEPVQHAFGAVAINHQPGGFFQVCPIWAWSAFDSILRGWDLSGDILFDLYSGVGFFSALLGDRFKNRVLIENNELAIHWANHNMKVLKLEALCLATDVDKWIESMTVSSKDLILLDPPRSGLTRAICTKLQTVAPAALVLIGCDGAVFCRDLKLLEPFWHISDLVAIDLFPMTNHVEFIALLHKK